MRNGCIGQFAILIINFGMEKQPELRGNKQKQHLICVGGLFSLNQMFGEQKRCQPLFSSDPQISKYLEQLENQSTNDVPIYIYNVSQLVHWTQLQLNSLHKQLDIDECSLKVALLMMRMMEILTICRFIRAMNMKNKNNTIQKQLVLLIQKRKIEIAELGKKIRQNKSKQSQCVLISESKRKEAQQILNQYQPILQKIALRYRTESASQVLKTAEEDIECIFKSILRNLGRNIFARTEGREEPELMGIFLKVFYLMVALDNKLQETINNIARDLMHKYRKLTYIHLLSESNGLKMLTVYLQQAPLTDIWKDIKLMRELLDNRKK